LGVLKQESLDEPVILIIPENGFGPIYETSWYNKISGKLENGNILKDRLALI